jgi:SET domain-containing protein
LLNDDIEIRPSSIHGQGLFALRRFEAGEIVLRWNLTHTIPTDQVLSLAAEERPYTHPLNQLTTIIIQRPERFVNHSCDNNTVVREFCDVAIRPIEPGEEITSDYSSDGSEATLACTCGAQNCRGVIN